MIPSPGRDQRLTARVAPGINLGVVQGDSCYGENFVKQQVLSERFDLQ